MKLKNGFITYTTDQEQIMVSAGSNAFHGMVRSNKTAAFVIDCLKEPCEKAELIEKMAEKYDAPREVLERDVERVLEVLRKIGALDE